MEFALQAQRYHDALTTDTHLSVGKTLHKHIVMLGCTMEFTSFEELSPASGVYGEDIKNFWAKANKVIDKHFSSRRIHFLALQDFETAEDGSKGKASLDWDNYLNGILSNGAFSTLGPATTDFLICFCKAICWKAKDSMYLTGDEDPERLCLKSLCLMKIFKKAFIVFRRYHNVSLAALSGFEFEYLQMAVAATKGNTELLGAAQSGQPRSDPLISIAESLGPAAWHPSLFCPVGGFTVSGFQPGEVNPHVDLATFIVNGQPSFRNVYNVCVPGFNGCVYICIAFVVACKRNIVDGLKAFLSTTKIEEKPSVVRAYERLLEDKAFVCDNLRYLLENSAHFPRFSEFSKVRMALEKFSQCEGSSAREWSRLPESYTCETDVVCSLEPMLWVELSHMRPESGKRKNAGTVNILHTATDINGHLPAVGVLATQMTSGHCSILLCQIVPSRCPPA